MQGVVFPRKRVSLGDIFQKKRGLVIFGGTFLKCAGTTNLSVLLLDFSFSRPRKYLVRGPKKQEYIYIRHAYRPKWKFPSVKRFLGLLIQTIDHLLNIKEMLVGLSFKPQNRLFQKIN